MRWGKKFKLSLRAEKIKDEHKNYSGLALDEKERKERRRKEGRERKLWQGDREKKKLIELRRMN